MGDLERSKKLSAGFGNRTMKAIALYSFDKCANCVKRLSCANELLSTGGEKYPIHKIMYSMLNGCPPAKFKGTGIIPREVGGFLKRECHGCDKLGICTGYVAEFVQLDEDKTNQLKEKVLKCTECEDLESCIQYFMTELKITNFSLMKNGFLLKFKRCNKEAMCTTSLDLPEDAPGVRTGSSFNVKKT